MLDLKKIRHNGNKNMCAKSLKYHRWQRNWSFCSPKFNHYLL